MPKTGLAQDDAGVCQTPVLAQRHTYFAQDGPTQGNVLNDKALHEAQELLVKIAGSGDKEEQQGWLQRLCTLQEQSNDLVKKIGIKVEKLPEGGLAVSSGESSIWDTIGGVADLITVAGMIFGGANQLSGGKLKKWFSEKIISQTKPFLTKTLPKVGRGIVQAGTSLFSSVTPFFEKTLPNVGRGIVQAGKGFLSSEAVKATAIQFASAFAAPALFFGLGYLTKDDPEVQETRRRLDAGEMTEQDYLEHYGDTPLGRSQWIGYLAGHDEERYWLERSLGEESMTFSEANWRRMKMRGDNPELDRAWGGEYTIIKDEEGRYVKRVRHEARQNQSTNEMEPNNIKNPLTGAKLGSLRDVWTEADQPLEADYHYFVADDRDEPALSGQTAAGVVIDWPRAQAYVEAGMAKVDMSVLIEALGRLAESCALPRVTVGSLAEALVVREDADIDRIATELARRLRETQMVS